MGYEFIYFYILCRYLTFKLKNLNQCLRRMKTEIQMRRIGSILNAFDDLYSEIKEYNATYWSKILLNLWLCQGTANVILFFSALNSKVDLILRLILMYTSVVGLFIFVIMITIAASVNREANISYKLMNSLFARNRDKSFRRRFKVSILIGLLLNFIHLLNRQ